jgi:hypothetical protein
MTTATKYYIYSVDTSNEANYGLETSPICNGRGILLGGPFTTEVLAQTWIKNNYKALNNCDIYTGEIVQIVHISDVSFRLADTALSDK